ncbi:MAG: family 43 glycosylhydrolase [Chthonomonadales bacterium]|nr:family 43 glycosylhydrolase [Chthonomonadales bacterium]
MRSLRLLFVLGALVSALHLTSARAVGLDAAQRSAPARTYTNPVWAHDFPDPFIIHHGGMFYAYATETRVTGFQVMESPDLVHWTHRGIALEVPWSRVHYWAPEVVRRRGKFYMTYSALNPATRKHDIGIATSRSPLGPFTHRAVLVRGDQNRVGVIDATVFLDRGRPYLIYSEEEPRRIVMATLSDDMLRTVGGITELIRPDRDWETGVTEAPTLVLRNGVYHLFYSAGWYQSGKRDPHYVVAHAASRSLTGPYVKTPQPILRTAPGKVYGPGHQCVLQLPSGEWWMAYHGWDNQNEPRYGSNPLGRTLRIDRLVWLAGVPEVLGPSLDPRPAPRVEADRSAHSERSAEPAAAHGMTLAAVRARASSAGPRAVGAGQ